MKLYGTRGQRTFAPRTATRPTFLQRFKSQFPSDERYVDYGKGMISPQSEPELLAGVGTDEIWANQKLDVFDRSTATVEAGEVLQDLNNLKPGKVYLRINGLGPSLASSNFYFYRRAFTNAVASFEPRSRLTFTFNGHDLGTLVITRDKNDPTNTADAPDHEGYVHVVGVEKPIDSRETSFPLGLARPPKP